MKQGDCWICSCGSTVSIKELDVGATEEELAGIRAHILEWMEQHQGRLHSIRPGDDNLRLHLQREHGEATTTSP